jgi:hypothetical protein
VEFFLPSKVKEAKTKQSLSISALPGRSFFSSSFWTRRQLAVVPGSGGPESSSAGRMNTSSSPIQKNRNEVELTPLLWAWRTERRSVLFSFGQPQREKKLQRKNLVRMRGLEPPRVSPLPPQGSVSTSSTTSAPKTVAIASAIELNYFRHCRRVDLRSRYRLWSGRLALIRILRRSLDRL